MIVLDQLAMLMIKHFFSGSVYSTQGIEIIEQITAIDSLCYKNKLMVSKSAEGNFYIHES